jgi:hypothetical protein
MVSHLQVLWDDRQQLRVNPDRVLEASAELLALLAVAKWAVPVIIRQLLQPDAGEVVNSSTAITASHISLHNSCVLGM